MTTPWKTDKYFVSPLNYLPEVTKDYHLPAKIKIHDITLRDGEQETGIALQKDEKVAIAEALAEAGVHRIEAGMPAVSKQDENAIREIVKRNLGCQRRNRRLGSVILFGNRRRERRCRRRLH